MNTHEILSKERRLLWTPFCFIAVILLWLAQSFYFFSALKAYHALAPQLAMLSNRRGATEMMLAPLNDAVLWVIIVGSVFFGGRLMTCEYQSGSMRFWRQTPTLWRRMLWNKVLILIEFSFLLALPFWLWVLTLAGGTHWDIGLLWGFLLSQITIAVCCSCSAVALGLWLQQPLATALFLALGWVGFWLLPTLFEGPPVWVAFLRWLSPLSQAHWLRNGILSVQWGVFMVVETLAWITLISIAEEDE